MYLAYFHIFIHHLLVFCNDQNTPILPFVLLLLLLFRIPHVQWHICLFSLVIFVFFHTNYNYISTDILVFSGCCWSLTINYMCNKFEITYFHGCLLLESQLSKCCKLLLRFRMRMCRETPQLYQRQTLNDLFIKQQKYDSKVVYRDGKSTGE